MPIELFCRRCTEGYRVREQVPAICPRCLQPTIWVSAFELDPPKEPYAVTANDRKFLRSLRIDGEG